VAFEHGHDRLPDTVPRVDGWVQVDSTDVGVNGSVFTQEDLQAAFPGTPTASRVHF